MEKKGLPRLSSTPAKSNGSFDRKTDPSSANKHYGRHGKRRDNANGRGTQPDFSTRKPLPQKSRSALDKRPRQRGGDGYRQREEVAESEGTEADSPFLHQGYSKKGNLNHLLNFHLAPREHVVGSNRRPGVRGRPRVTYNKERYLQANCQFVVKDSGDYSVQATDPDTLVSWDLVEQVRTSIHEQATCPICLQNPLAGKITKCGHVYCWACILHYLTLDDKSWRKCPICYEAIHKSDLRSVKVLEKTEQKVGHTITFQLMKRERYSTYAVPLTQWQDRQGRPQNIDDEKNTEFAKVLVASTQQIQADVIEEERRELQLHMASAEPSEVCFIESAMVDLAEREEILKGKAEAEQENAELLEQLEGATGSDHSDKDDSQGGGVGGAASVQPTVTQPLPVNMSFDGSKIRKQYADAFDELEEEEDEEEESVVSLDLSDAEGEDDRESMGSRLSVSSPVSDPDASQPVPIPSCHSVSSSEDVQSLSADSVSMLPPELAAEATMTAEEAVQQLTLPSDLDRNDNSAGHRRGGKNLSKKAFYFYQASDGQHIYLHSVNARCIDDQYRGLEHGPHTITASIVDKEIAFMTQDIRQRLRYLSHLPLTCEFQVAEVKLEPPVVSQETLRRFAGPLKQRAQNRQKVKREDRRQARKQTMEERKSYGFFPDLQLSLDSTDHFPAPVSDLDERRRLSSLSDASLTSPTIPCPLELNANATEFVPRPKADQSPPEIVPISFAAKLKQPARPTPVSSNTTSTAWPAASGPPLPKRRPDSDESDNEDRVPVPAFNHSFSDAITSALQTVTIKEPGDQGAGAGKGGKKKKKEKKLLFSTSMMRR
ncbi:hypothetical protein V1264_021369 [Littorina saxatilis]